jgi:hypothetical protein
MAEKTSFADYKPDAAIWITLATGEFYPDILPAACELDKPVLTTFGDLLKQSVTSVEFFNRIAEVREGWMRVQLARVFRKYVSPATPVELLKKKAQAKYICDTFGPEFRPIVEVQKAFVGRPLPDEALCAVLWEYKDRGKKGYDLTERLFALLAEQLPDMQVTGPKRAGKDVPMRAVFADYPNPTRPVDFVIRDQGRPVAVGLVRYDSDRGGAQEDDRPGQYRDCAQELLGYAAQHGLNLKVVFVNDGPGLLLGTMWDDYAAIERSNPDRIRVVTLRMVPERLTPAWLLG